MVLTALFFVMLSIAGDWLKYDDDDVSAVSEEEILNLSGGGMHCT